MGPANAERCIAAVAAAGHALGALAQFQPPPAARDAWPAFAALMAGLGSPRAAWPGQVEQVRRWYQPLLEQRYDSAGVRAGDLDMLEQVSGQFPSRERFLTELTLDPPQATGDLSGPPLLDEDYLVLSTVHSAKGQEWDAVFVLNVADGNFPSEFAAGREEQIEEERRLLYVAMSRARDQLHLVEPQRYYVTQQSRRGDAHVYGARSRFLTDAVLATLDRDSFGAAPPGIEAPAPSAGVTVDVGARLRGMW
jgi:DNA helicase-2/ATP-dependent DNA helicase PcrA